MPTGSHAAAADRSQTLFDACLARLDAALEHAECENVIATWRPRGTIEAVYRRAARLPKQGPAHIPERLLLVALTGDPLPQQSKLLLNLDVRERVEREGPEPLLRLARAVEMGVADIARLNGESGVIGYYTAGGRVRSTWFGSYRRVAAGGSVPWPYGASFSEWLPARLLGLVLVSAAFGSIMGSVLIPFAAGAHHFIR